MRTLLAQDKVENHTLIFVTIMPNSITLGILGINCKNQVSNFIVAVYTLMRIYEYRVFGKMNGGTGGLSEGPFFRDESLS